MEIILKPHNQIELPQEVCRKMEWRPGVRFDIEINDGTGTVTLVPRTRKFLRVHGRAKKVHSRSSTESHK